MIFFLCVCPPAVYLTWGRSQSNWPVVLLKPFDGNGSDDGDEVIA